AHVEELVLHAAEDRIEPGLRLRALERHAHDANRGVELVDGAVGLDARRVLADARAADEGGGAVVAGLGVDTIDAHHYATSACSGVAATSSISKPRSLIIWWSAEGVAPGVVRYPEVKMEFTA